MRVLLIEAQNGISGDMFVAAAASLADCEAEVTALPRRLGLPGVHCRFSNVLRSTLQCRHFLVSECDTPAAPIQDHADQHHEAGETHAHEHGDQHHHSQDAEHAHEQASHDYRHHGHSHHEDDGGHHHERRTLAVIQEMIRRADLESPVRDRALRMFERLGAVEAAAHGLPIKQVHFHEVGAIDSIVDIVAAALCIERLKIAEAYSTPVCVGSGSVRTAHGLLPVPAPATEKLLQGIPTIVGDLTGEWTTPTGALILQELQPKFSIPTLVTLASTLGGGTRNPPRRLNVLRLRLAESAAGSKGSLARDEVCMVLGI